MADMIRWKDAGAKLTEDCGIKSSNVTERVECDTFVNTPFGKRIHFTLGTYIDTKQFQSFIQDSGVFTIAFKFMSNDFSTSFQRLLWAQDSGPVNGWRVQIQSNAINFLIYNNDNAVINASKGALVEGQQYTITLVGDGTNVEWFVDGVSLGSSGMTTGNLGGIQTLATSISFPSTQVQDAWVSDLVIDDRAWSDQEVEDYHNNSTFDYDKNIVSNWNLDSTDTIKDVSPFGTNDGTVTGSPDLVNTSIGHGLSMSDDDYVDIGTDLKVEGNQTIISCFNNVVNPAVASDIAGRYVSGTPSSSRIWLFVNNVGKFNVRLGKIGVTPIPFTSVDLTGSELDIVATIIDRDSHEMTLISEADEVSIDISSSDDVSQGELQRLGEATSSPYPPVEGSHNKFMVLNKCITKTQYLDIVNRIKRGEL